MNEPQLKDLSQEPPRSPRVRVGGYVILGRTADKCRALLNNQLGEYHFDCPLDRALFEFAGVTGDQFKSQVAGSASDEELARWLDTEGNRNPPDAVKKWSDAVESSSMRDDEDPEKSNYFREQTKKLGLDPETVSTFDWLEADDDATFALKQS